MVIYLAVFVLFSVPLHTRLQSYRVRVSLNVVEDVKARMGLDLVVVAVVALSGLVVALLKLRDLSMWGGIIPKFWVSIGYSSSRLIVEFLFTANHTVHEVDFFFAVRQQAVG